MNKKYVTVTEFNELKAEVTETNALLKQFIASQSQAKPETKQPKAGTSKKAKSPKKGTSKAAKAAKSNDFDRSLYEATAKKLGCFAYGKVVATVVDGKVVRTQHENRQLVYAAMGYSK